MERTEVKRNDINESRIIYCDYLRVLAAFCVVILHAASQYWNIIDINSTKWFILNCYDSITRWAVPVFVMISGTLLLGRDIPLKRLFGRNILHLLSAFIFWTVVYCIFNRRTVPDLFYYLLVGNHHMWYIGMIIGLYICLPIIRKITESMSLCVYYLILWFAFAFLIPHILLLTSYSGSDTVHTIRAGIQSQMDNIDLNLILGYVGYFILGFCLNDFQLNKRIRYIIYSLGIIGFFSTIAFTAFFSVRLQTPIGDFYSNFSPNVLMEAIAVYTFFRYNTICSNKLKNIIMWISKHCFGIYLVHVLVLDFMDRGFGLNTMSFHPILSVPVISGIVFGLSLLLTWLISKMPIVCKYII